MAMDATRWQQVEAVCFSALELSTGARADYVARACGADAELLREVATLLEQLERQPSFLEHPLVDLSEFVPAEAAPELPAGTSIGAYRIVRLVGHGGMGEVYLATRDAADIRQEVALKLIRRGMDTEEILRRFRLERRILASLQHPNIARLLDASATDDGRPYYVMEFIDGLPLDEYCDRNCLTIRDRLVLFQTICAAVQHAHQHLVVHRDLKPRNILVTADGVPKLLDFGIGKVLAPGETSGSAIETGTEVRLLTPEYAAPEQVTGGSVTTATDVYALGVMLYEMLAGHHPYLSGRRSRRDAERAVLESTPSRPSVMVSRVEVRPGDDTGAAPLSPAEISHRRGTEPARLQRRLAGDLDNIVLKALRKEPERRYPSAAMLAQDLQRHLDGLPVLARPDTFRYRAQKFIGRHAGAVTATTVGILALAASTVITLVQNRRVEHESERVTLERDKALEVRGFLMEMFGATGADQAVGDTVTARQLLDLQVAQLKESYLDRPDLQAEMMEVLADGYDRLGLYADAEPLARQALALRRRVLGDRNPDVASSLNTLGWILHERGETKEAEPLLLESAAIRREAGPRYRVDLSHSLNDLGVVYNATNRYAEAESVLTEALAIRRAADGDAHRATGTTASNLAAALYFQSHLDSAIAVQELAVRALQASVGPDHQRTVVALSNLAAFRHATGDAAGAEASYRELLARQTRIQGPDHPVTARVISSLAAVLYDRGMASGADSVFAESEAMYRRALAILEPRLGPTHPQVGVLLDHLAAVEIERGRLTDAASDEQRSLAILRRALGDSNPNVTLGEQRLAAVAWRRGDTAEALRIQRGVVASLQRSLGAHHAETAKAEGTLCDLMLFRGDDPADAERLCREADQVLTPPPGGRVPGPLFLIRLRIAQARFAQGDRRAADSILRAVQGTFGDGRAGSYERAAIDSLTHALEGPGR